MQDDKSRETMRRIAADYERLANHAEERARGSSHVEITILLLHPKARVRTGIA
jgi:hypothetical protein